MFSPGGSNCSVLHLLALLLEPASLWPFRGAIRSGMRSIAVDLSWGLSLSSLGSSDDLLRSWQQPVCPLLNDVSSSYWGFYFRLPVLINSTSSLCPPPLVVEVAFSGYLCNSSMFSFCFIRLLAISHFFLLIYLLWSIFLIGHWLVQHLVIEVVIGKIPSKLSGLGSSNMVKSSPMVDCDKVLTVPRALGAKKLLHLTNMASV